MPICNSSLLRVVGQNHAIQYESCPSDLSIKSHGQDHLSDFLSKRQCFWLAEMGVEMLGIRFTCVELTSWPAAHVEGGPENNLPGGIHVESGIEASCSQTMSKIGGRLL